MTKVRISGMQCLGIGTDDERIVNAKLSELHTFKNHPFLVKDDARMAETVESIRKYGVLTPGIVRPRLKGGYELISGHRRKRACEILELPTMPVFVRNYTDDQAIVIMVDANIQREDILPSEKAKAYKMKYQALKRQGKKGNGRTLDLMGKEAKESEKTVQRYICMANLIDSLLYMVDEKKLGINPAVQLSYIDKKKQEIISDCISSYGLAISSSQAKKLRLCINEETDREEIVSLLLENRSNKNTISIDRSLITEFIPKDYSNNEIKDLIISLITEWSGGK